MRAKIWDSDSVSNVLKETSLIAEIKYDGERFHIHKNGDEFRCFSRPGNDYSDVSFEADICLYANSGLPWCHTWISSGFNTSKDPTSKMGLLRSLLIWRSKKISHFKKNNEFSVTMECSNNVRICVRAAWKWGATQKWYLAQVQAILSVAPCALRLPTYHLAGSTPHTGSPWSFGILSEGPRNTFSTWTGHSC